MRDSPSRSSSGEAKPLNVRIFDLYILTFNGFFDSESDILKPRWLPTKVDSDGTKAACWMRLVASSMKAISVTSGPRFSNQ